MVKLINTSHINCYRVLHEKEELGTRTSLFDFMRGVFILEKKTYFHRPLFRNKFVTMIYWFECN